ncbi:MAG TPA: DMT family transporter [Xanthobacteraceae bacterium]|nr:DMT family transporter [Xanthobacteraceae bacterium]
MRTSNVPAAILWMVGTLLAFSLMAISVRQLGRILNLYELLMVRSVGGLVILLIVMAAQPALFGTLAMRKPGMHLLRNGAHFVANLGWTNAVIVMPLATVFAIEFLMPVWAGLLAVLFLGERFTVSRAGSIAMGFLGVLIILRPGIEAFQPAALGVLLASLGYAVSNIGTKKLIPVQSTIAILFWMNVMQAVMALVGSDLAFPLRLDAHHWTWVIGIAVGGTAAHYCLTNALRVADAMVVIPLDFLRIPLIAFVGWMFYAERLDLLVFVGAAIIVAGIMWNLRAEMR